MSSINDFEWDEEPMKKIEQQYEEMQWVLFNILHESSDDETPSGLAYCGCETCFTRETLATLMPGLLDAYDAGHIRRLP